MTDESVPESVVAVERIYSMVALQGCDGDASLFEIRDGLNQHMLCVSGLRRADPSSIASLPWGECEQSSMYTLINKIRGP